MVSLSFGILAVHLSPPVVSLVRNLLSSLFINLFKFTTLVNTYDVEWFCTWTLVMTWSCHRLKWLCLPHPLFGIFFSFLFFFFFTFFLCTSRGLNSIFFQGWKVTSSIRAVPCMGLVSHLHLRFWESAIVLLWRRRFCFASILFVTLLHSIRYIRYFEGQVLY